EQWPVCAQLLAHAQALLDHARAAQLSSPAVASLLTRIGNYVWARGLDLRLGGDGHKQGPGRRGRELDEQALAMDQRLYEGDHPDVAADLSNLANALSELGEHGRAREL